MSIECVGYLRVSGQDQIDGDGFPRQCEAIEQWCQRNGYILTCVYLERGVSGRRGMVDSDVDRPAFTDMVTALLGNCCRVVVVECMDRFARNMMVQTQLIAYLKTKDLKLISAMTSEVVTDIDPENDPLRWAMVQIQGVLSELDRNMTVRKLRLARERERRETGICEGPRPFGLDPKKTDEHPVRQHILGLSEAGRTNAEIAAQLNGDGLRTRQGALWTNRTVNKVVKKHRLMEGAASCR